MTNTRYHRTLSIGLTGGIGSGKTEVGKFFEQMGAYFLQTDLIARTLINSDERIKRQLRSLFGEGIYDSDGSLDRHRVGTMIFNDQSLQMKVNQIVHPPVITYINQEIKKAVKSHLPPLIIIEAALIFEAGVESMFDYTIVVDTAPEQRIVRLMNRDSRNRDEILKRFSAQLDQSIKIEKADFVIRNDGSMQTLQEQCKFLFHLFSTIAEKTSMSGSEGVE